MTKLTITMHGDFRDNRIVAGDLLRVTDTSYDHDTKTTVATVDKPERRDADNA